MPRVFFESLRVVLLLSFASVTSAAHHDAIRVVPRKRGALGKAFSHARSCAAMAMPGIGKACFGCLGPHWCDTLVVVITA